MIKMTRSKGFRSTISWLIYLLSEFSCLVLDGNLVPTVPFIIHGSRLMYLLIRALIHLIGLFNRKHILLLLGTVFGSMVPGVDWESTCIHHPKVICVQ